MTRAEVILGVVVALTLAWGIRERDWGRERRRQLEAALAAKDSAIAAWDADRVLLLGQMDSLRADSAVLEARRRAMTRAARDSIGRLLALILDSSSRQAAEGAVRIIGIEVEACEAQLANCEARAANAEARAVGDSAQFADYRLFVHDTLEVAWQDAERRARPNALRDFWRSRSLTLPVAAAAFIAGMVLSR